VKIKVLCEGQTEEGLRALLSKAVDIRKCGIHIRTYEGVAQLLRKLDGRIREELRSGAEVVFCLVDYHHFPLSDEQKFLPLEQRVAAIQGYIAEQIHESRRESVRCHIVVHEVEAWIIADEQAVAQRLKINNLAAWAQPETINDMNPPAKVLEQLFRTRSPLKKRYIKAKDGVDLLRKVDCQKVYDKCPTFKKLVDDLRSYCQ
jgi:hypothetical protein